MYNTYMLLIFFYRAANLTFVRVNEVLVVAPLNELQGNINVSAIAT